MADDPPGSAWSPLSHPVFRVMWIASLVSNIGTWMQNVGGVWFMSSLSPSPFMVALMQTTTTLHDTADPAHYVETFVVESWVEHLRQHQRGTSADRAIEEAVHAFHVGGTPPQADHLIYARPKEDTS